MPCCLLGLILHRLDFAFAFYGVVSVALFFVVLGGAINYKQVDIYELKTAVDKCACIVISRCRLMTSRRVDTMFLLTCCMHVAICCWLKQNNPQVLTVNRRSFISDNQVNWSQRKRSMLDDCKCIQTCIEMIVNTTKFHCNLQQNATRLGIYPIFKESLVDKFQFYGCRWILYQFELNLRLLTATHEEHFCSCVAVW